MEMFVCNANISAEVTEAAIRHKGKEIRCNIALFDRVSYDGKYDLFQHNNQYWATLPEDQQDRIFNLYEQIRSLYDVITNVSDLDDKLIPLVNELVMEHNLEQIEFWVKYNSDIVIPQDIGADFVESEISSNNITRVKTYLRKDYQELVVMTIVFRALIPIWGEYIYNTKNEYGTEYKEYYAFKLIKYSVLDNCSAMIKLRDYVTHNIPSDKERSKATVIIGGVSTEDLPDWLLGLVVIRKLSAGDLRGVDTDGHLISSAYNYIFNKLKTLENSFAGNVRDKVPEDKSVDENKASLLEGYRAKQNISDADIEATQFFVLEPLNDGVPEIAKFICPDIPDELIMDSVSSIEPLYSKPINHGQKLIAQWVLAKLISPGIIGMTEKSVTIRALATAQAILWHRGHYQLAAFVSAMEYVNNNQIIPMLGSDSKARIPKDDLEILDSLFPFSRKPGGKKKIFKKINPAVNDIELVATMLAEKDWVLTIPDHWMKQQSSIFGGRRRIGVPHDIRPLLSSLVIDVAKGEFNIKGIM